jgi:hypothetical protein
MTLALLAPRRSLGWMHALALTGCSMLLACTVATERPPQLATAAAPPPPPVVGPAPAPPTPAPSPVPAAQNPALRDKLAAAIAHARLEGWVHKRTVEIPGRAAAIALYDPAPESAPAFKSMRADAIGVSGAPYTLRSGVIDVVGNQKKSVLWDLTGEGPRFIVLHLTRCEPQCGTPEPVVLELAADDGISRKREAPQCPTCIDDADRDGIPEFAFRMVDLEIAPCSRASCGPETALLVQVRGFESWDGERFAPNLKAFVPLYRARLDAARAEVRRVRRAARKQNTCPLSALRVAAELFVYSRLTGATENDAFNQADQLMAGYSTDPCRVEYDLLAPPRSWVELRSELVAEKLPVLDADRKR